MVVFCGYTAEQCQRYRWRTRVHRWTHWSVSEQHRTHFPTSVVAVLNKKSGELRVGDGVTVLSCGREPIPPPPPISLNYRKRLAS